MNHSRGDVEMRGGTASTGTGAWVHLVSCKGALSGRVVLEAPAAGVSGEHGGVLAAAGCIKAKSSGQFSVAMGAVEGSSGVPCCRRRGHR